jgi:hypothetical protein
MKNLSVIFALSLFAVAACAALPQPDLIAQVHFAGAQKIFAQTNAVAFTNEFCCTEALALRAEVATKLSGWLAGWLQTNLNVSVAGGGAKLRPLFEDLQTAEFYAEARSAANGRPELAIAIKLEATRVQLWQANLKPFFAAASFKSADGWLIFDSDPAPAESRRETAAEDCRGTDRLVGPRRQLAAPRAMVSQVKGTRVAGNAIHRHRAGRQFPDQRKVRLPRKPCNFAGTLACAHERAAFPVR